jgi:hypothetical protein
MKEKPDAQNDSVPFAESVRKVREATHRHAHREILAFNVGLC